MEKTKLILGLVMLVSVGFAEQVVLFNPSGLSNNVPTAAATFTNDTSKVWNFSDSTPLFNGEAAWGTKVYGGQNLSVTVGPIGTILAINLSIDQLLVQASGGSNYVATVKGLLLWKKGDFLIGDSSTNFVFDTTTNSSLSVDLFRHYGDAQWVIRDDDTFYISDLSFTGSGLTTSSLSGTDTVQWASWDPTADGGAGFTNVPSSGFVSQTFSNVTAVGVYYETTRAAGLPSMFKMLDGGFSANLVPVPVPEFHGVTNFYANFDSATPTNLQALADNDARTAVLDTGTAVGSWTVTNNPASVFALVSDGAGNNGLVVDNAGMSTIIPIAIGSFDGGTIFLPDGTNESTFVKFRWMKTDPGAGNVERAFFELCNSVGNLVAGLRWEDGTSAAAADGPITHGELNHGSYSNFSPVFQADRDQASTADPYDPGNMIDVMMEFFTDTVIYNIDTDLDGVYELVSTNAITRNNIETLQLWVSNNAVSGNPGFWLDDIEVLTGYYGPETTSSLYETWAAGYPTMTNGNPQVDFDNDGLINLYEYGLGGNPTNGFVDGEIPTFGNVVGALEYIHAQRNDDASLSYYLELTGDLVFPGWTNAGYTVTGTNITAGTFDYVTNQIPTTDPKKFVRLIIE